MDLHLNSPFIIKMNMEIKVKFIDDTQKIIARECSSRCFQKGEECYTECYRFSLKAFNITAQRLKKEGYRCNSRYINLAYGEERDEWDTLVSFNDEVPDIMGNPHYYFEKYMHENTKEE